MSADRVRDAAFMTVTAPVVRRLTDADADAMADLATLCEIAETGEPDPEVVDWIHATSGTEPTGAIRRSFSPGVSARSWV